MRAVAVACSLAMFAMPGQEVEINTWQCVTKRKIMPTQTLCATIVAALVLLALMTLPATPRQSRGPLHPFPRKTDTSAARRCGITAPKLEEWLRRGGTLEQVASQTSTEVAALEAMLHGQ